MRRYLKRVATYYTCLSCPYFNDCEIKTRAQYMGYIKIKKFG
ncbi:hypothetical protein CCP3SC5AM1_1750003 [Gammaproteobacteria bacterium]